MILTATFEQIITAHSIIGKLQINPTLGIMTTGRMTIKTLEILPLRIRTTNLTEIIQILDFMTNKIRVSISVVTEAIGSHVTVTLNAAKTRITHFRTNQTTRIFNSDYPTKCSFVGPYGG